MGFYKNTQNKVLRQWMSLLKVYSSSITLDVRGMFHHHGEEFTVKVKNYILYISDNCKPETVSQPLRIDFLQDFFLKQYEYLNGLLVDTWRLSKVVLDACVRKDDILDIKIIFCIGNQQIAIMNIYISSRNVHDPFTDYVLEGTYPIYVSCLRPSYFRDYFMYSFKSLTEHIKMDR